MPAPARPAVNSYTGLNGPVEVGSYYPDPPSETDLSMGDLDRKRGDVHDAVVPYRKMGSPAGAVGTVYADDCVARLKEVVSRRLMSS